ncbi:unnamed protein product [Candidula unifasciata]|uniref:Uncharacterized protein n=1 Tax=Candidula unifasciata TaxID=100452 RepID=A0A8S3Z6I7_9EUPU|nr:unnamed protein product [Candidula unifasciata]
MRTRGFFSCAALVLLLIAIGLLVASMVTTGWLSGSYTLGHVYRKNCNVGLFTVSIDGEEYDRRRFFRIYKVEFQTTVILQSFGGGHLLLATPCYILFLTTFSGPGFLFYFLFAGLSGIFLLAGSLYFRFNVTVVNLSPDFSWYLSLLASIFACSSIGVVKTAITRGELETEPKPDNVDIATNVQHIRL